MHKISNTFSNKDSISQYTVYEVISQYFDIDIDFLSLKDSYINLRRKVERSQVRRLERL